MQIHYQQPYLPSRLLPCWWGISWLVSFCQNSFQPPQVANQKDFVKLQEARRKDVECAFGVLWVWFVIVSHLAQGWKHHNLNNIKKCCIILHSIIVEDQRDSYLDYSYNTNPAEIITPVDVSHKAWIPFADFINNFHSIRDSDTHYQLQTILSKHLWEVKAYKEEDSDKSD